MAQKFRGALLGALALVVLLFGAPTLAQAAGSPNITVAATSPTVLYGNDVTFDASASNPASEPYGYNLSFRIVLPAGVSYVAGSASVAGSVTDPVQIANQPGPGQTTLIFSNLSDLSPGSTFHFDGGGFKLHYAQTGPNALDANDTFTVPVQAFVNTDPRYVPKFAADGTPISGSTSYTGSDGPANGTPKLVPLQITKSEPSPEGKLLRGVHDHQTTYTLTVKNNTVNPTTGTTVEDYLPASLEFLGCGGSNSDNTTDAPTNPNGGPDEYPGSGPINVAAVSGCVTPRSVDTVDLAAGNPQGLPAGVYTHVVWPATDLSAGETYTITYAAAIPLRENTMTWTTAGGAPSATSLTQTANLDNNNGPQIQDNQSITNYTMATGTYQSRIHSPSTATATNSLTRMAEEWRILKSGSSSGLSQGALTTWTLTLSTSEYAFVTNGTVTDTIPNGMCPLGPVNYAATLTNGDPNASECAPSGDQPSAPYQSVTPGPNGTWVVAWDKTTLANLAKTAVDDTFTITFPTRTRTYYYAGPGGVGSTSTPTTPLLTSDALTNNVHTDAQVYPRCIGTPTNDTGCSATVSHDVVPGSTVTDDSSAVQTAEGPVVSKLVADSGSSNCSTANYVTTVPTYHPGDLICWKLGVQFPMNLDTKPVTIKDFLPQGTSFVTGSEQATGNDTSGVTFVNESPTGVLNWAAPSPGGVVPKGGKVMERVFQTTAAPIGTPQNGDIQGNLFKFSYVNTAGVSVPLRVQRNYQLAVPNVGLTKGIYQVDRGASTVAGPFTPLQSTQAVQGGDVVTYHVDLANTGQQDAQNMVVWDNLPSGISCTDLVLGSISNGGTCTTTLGQSRITWNGLTVAQAGSLSLSYKVTVPTSGPGTSYTNHAGVVSFQGATTDPSNPWYTYTPANNINPSAPTPNAPAADQTAEIHTPGAVVVKGVTTEVNEPGNNTPNQATIGEKLTYTVTATIPAGTTVNAAQLTDTLFDGGAQQSYVPGSATATLDGTPLPTAGFSLDTTGITPVVNFPASFVSGATNRTVILTFSTLVKDVAANVRGGALQNDSKLAWNDPVSGTRLSVPSNTQYVRIVEPQISQTKSHAGTGSLTPGSIATFTLTTSNGPAAAYVSEAHNVTLVDCVPVGLTVVDNSGNPLANGAAIPANPGPGTVSGTTYSAGATPDCPGASGEITRTLSTLDPGSSSSFTYNARIDLNAIGGAALTNTVTTRAESLDNTHPDRRTSGSATNAGYIATANDTVHVVLASVTKGVDKATATIGNLLTYTVNATIPANVNLYNATVLDTVPDSVDVVPASVTAANCVVTGGTLPNPIQPYTVPAPASVPASPGTTPLGWYLGNLSAAGTDRVVTCTFQGYVRNTHRNGGANVLNGESITNSVVVASNEADSGYAFTPSTVPTQGTFQDVSPPATATTNVIEPQVSIDKKVQVDNGPFVDGPATAQPGDTFTYQLTVTNPGIAGSASAYDVQVTDMPDVELQNVVAATGSSMVTQPWTPGSHQMKWTIPGPIAPGASVVLTYTATLVPNSQLTANPTAINNTASIPQFWGVPQATRDANPLVIYRSYAGNSDNVQVNLHFPTFSIDKTTGLSGNPDTGPAQVGQAFPWRIVVSNTDSVASASNVTVRDTLPPNWTYVSGTAQVNGTAVSDPTITPNAAGDNLDFTIPSIPAGGSPVITFSAKPTLAAVTTPGTGAQANVNTAKVTSAQDAGGNYGHGSGPNAVTYGTGPDTATATLLAPQLTITKEPKGGAATAGSNSSFTITVGNSGAATATNVDVTDALPSGLTYAAGTATASPSTGFSEASVSNGGVGPATIHWTIASIPAGGSVAITVPVTLDPTLASGTVLTNTSSATSPDVPGSVTDTGSLNVSTSADVSIVKSGAATYTAGQNYTWHLRVRNAGPSVARSVSVSDALPAGTTFVSADPACVNTLGTVSCSLGDLPVGYDHTYDVTVAVGSDVTTNPLDNTATVTSTTPDPDTTNNTSTFGPTPAPQADLSIVKSGAATYTAGLYYTWHLAVHNAGPSAAQNVSVSDPLPAGTMFISASAGCTNSAGTVTCAVGTLASGADQSYDVTVEVGSDVTADPLDNTATVTSTTPDPDTTNNTSTFGPTPAPQADLSIVKSGAATYTAGQNYTWHLAVHNAGPSAAQNVSVSDPLPAGTTFISASAGCTNSAGTVTCAVGTLAAGADQSYDVTVAVDPATTANPLDNTATVTSTTPDPDTTNNTSTFGPTPAPQADVSIVKTGAATYTAGQNYTWHLRVQNAGPSVARSVSVSDTLPAGTTFVSADTPCTNTAGTVTCALGDLAPGYDHTYDVTVAVGSDVTTNPLNNTATVTSTTPDPTPGNNTSTFGPTPAPQADVAIVKTASPSAILLGGQTTFTLVVTNNGPSTARNVTVSDPLPAELEFVSTDPGCTQASGTVTCTIGDLASGATRTFHVTATALAEGMFPNTATVTTSTPDPVPGNNTSTANVTVGPVADLSIVKTGPATVDAGGQITYSLKVTNNGPSNETGVTVTDPLPAGTTFVSADPGCTSASGTVTCAIGSLAHGASVTRQVTIAVPYALGGSTVTNTATVTGDQPDPVPGNNTSTVTTQVGPSTDLAITKVGPASAAADGTITWTIVATNNGPSTATGVTVTDPVPDGVTPSAATPSQGACTIAGQQVSCGLGTIASGGSVQIQLTGKVASSLAGQSVTNTAKVSGDQPDPVPGNNTATSTTPIGPPAPTDFDLSIAKTVPAGTKPKLGVPFTYDMVVTNSGPAAASKVTVLDTVPSALQVRSAKVAGGTCTVKGQVVRCTVDTLASGATAKATLEVLPIAAGTVKNTASVSASVPDRDPANNVSSVTVKVAAPATTVKLSKVASRPGATPGTLVRYRIVATNSGDAAAANVQVCDQLPRGTTLVSAPKARVKGDRVCWTVPFLAAGAKKAFVVSLRITSAAYDGPLTNIASVQVKNARTRQAKAKVNVQGARQRGGFTG